jgi:hypothetical protein
MTKKSKKSGVHHGKMPDGKGHSSVVKNKQGVPQAEPPRHKSLLGTLPTPDTQGEHHLETEKTKAQVEILLLKGLTSYSSIASTLGINHRTAKKYVEGVKYRWAALGGMPRMRQLRGEAKARLELITSELWVMYQNSDSETLKAACLRQLLETHDRQLILDGLTHQTLPAIAHETAMDSSEGISDQIRDHARIVELGRALMEYTKKNSSDVVDGDFKEVGNGADRTNLN